MSWRLIRKIIFLCFWIGVAALMFQVGDISSKAGGYIAERLQVLERTL
jgi:hypothetical protein